MNEIKIGFLRGIGFILAILVISILIGFAIWLLIFNIFKSNDKKCIAYATINNNKVCVQYE